MNSFINNRLNYNTMKIEKQTFFAMFGKHCPSVSLFNEILGRETLDIRIELFRFAFFLFINCFYEITKVQQDFLRVLVNRNLQHFYNYKLKHSGFNTLQCGVTNSRSIIRVSHMLMSDKENIHASYAQMAFWMAMAFGLEVNINTLSTYIRQCQFTPETFFELADSVQIYL